MLFQCIIVSGWFDNISLVPGEDILTCPEKISYLPGGDILLGRRRYLLEPFSHGWMQSAMEWDGVEDDVIRPEMYYRGEIVEVVDVRVGV